MTRKRRSKGRPISGVIVLDKHTGISSNDAVQRAKRMFRAQKVGHTGSLDPLATGVLPLCFGEATKFSQFLLHSDKSYQVVIRLGQTTDSGDSDGKILQTNTVEGITEEQIESALNAYRGTIQQVPSMFSAIKHNGQPLYKLARQGIEVERKPRTLTIFSNELIAFEGERLELQIHCTKGTYIRTIAEDLGADLGCGAHVIALKRIQAGPYAESDSLSFDDLEQVYETEGLSGLDKLLQPISSAVREWPEVRLTSSSAFYVRQGQAVLVPNAPTEGWVRLVTEDSEAAPDIEIQAAREERQSSDIRDRSFIGVGEVLDDGRIAPRRLLAAR
ncbi:MAG: tRNA pseudouridine(55) synthase TruB [Pseudomonadales bacterium]|nr:tRNA pseudouridine(55) synthase TruB [Pseudomonadales bacterium]